MSLCQPESPISCGGCCGILNLKLSYPELKTLLDDRTQEFKTTTDWNKKYTIPNYRKSRETKEKDIQKWDETTYNCPFLGNLSMEGKIGCMIHPIYTNDPLSQNFSFYGSSICQGYNCKNKERPTAGFWEDVVSRIFQDSLSYTHTISDPFLIPQLESWIQKKGKGLNEIKDSSMEFLQLVFRKRWEQTKEKGFTSFEFYDNGEAWEEFFENCWDLSLVILDKNKTTL
jgi:hypothetical protein